MDPNYEYPEAQQQVEVEQVLTPGDALSEADKRRVEEELRRDRVKGLIQQLSGVLSSALLLLGTLNIQFSWLTPESIDSFIVFLGAFAAFAVSIWTTYKNSFAWKKGQYQNRKIKEAEIAEELKDTHSR